MLLITFSNTSNAYAIDVGDVFWLSSSGVGMTVTGTSLSQPGVVRVDYKILPENAAEYCQRYEQRARLTPQHEECVARVMKNTQPRTALVNCSSRLLVLESGSFAKGDDHFWRSRTDSNSFVLGDELFVRTCRPGVNATPPAPTFSGSNRPYPGQPSTASPGDIRIGPSFDCTSKAATSQPLAQMICRSRDLAYWELSYVIAYQALREALPAQGRKAMVDEANELVAKLSNSCNLPPTGQALSPSQGQESCIRALFQESRSALISRASGASRDEAVLAPTQTLEIQRLLQQKRYLASTATLDGVFGPVSRSAISDWQRDNGLLVTGFGSQALLDKLSGAEASSPAPPSSPAPQSSSAPTPEPRVDRSGRTGAIKLVLSDGGELRPHQVFEKVAGAVFILKTNTALGSAVAISDRELLTNCHVLEGNHSATLEREGERLSVTLASAAKDADRCVLRISDATSPLSTWVRVRPYSDIKVGERVFTVGSPRGLELTLAEGIVSSKRSLDDGRLLQTSAPISRGSSGGGLFDAQGHLVGITTFMVKEGQNLNFAIAAEEYAK